MNNLDARIAAPGQGTRVRAHLGRDPTVGESRSGVPADAFEVVFRRMRSQASLAHPSVRESTSDRSPDSGGNASSTPVRAKSAQLVRIQDRATAGQTAASRESGPEPRGGESGANMEINTVDVALPRETVEASSVASRLASSTAAMATPPAKEAVLGSIIAEAEHVIANSDTAFPAEQVNPDSLTALPAEQFIPESVATLPAEQLTPESIAMLAAEQPVSESIAVPPAQQLILESVEVLAAQQSMPESAAVTPAQQLVPELIAGFAVGQLGPDSVTEPALDMRDGGAAGLGDKAELVMPSVVEKLPGADAITFVVEPQQDVLHTGDMIALYQQEAIAEFHAGKTPIGFVLEIPEHGSDALLASDGSIRGQPHEAAGPAGGLSTDALNGATLSQLAPAATTVNVTGIAREQLIDQVVRAVRVAQHNESTEVIVQLKPDFLGRLSIRVVSDNHAMHVEIRAENAAVRQVMQDNLGDLQQRLSDRGLGFNQFNVLADTGSNPQRQPEWHFGFPSIARSNAELKTLEEVPAVQMPVAAAGMIDYFA